MTFSPSQGYAFLTVALWSSAFVFTKVALMAFTSPALGFLRCLVASIALCAVLAAKRVPLPRWRDVPGLLLSGALGFAVYLLVFNKGSETLTSTTSCIIIATAPLITALLAAAVFRERLSAVGWCALCLEFGGVLILALWNGVVSINAGVLWMLAAALSISGYNIVQRLFARRYSALELTTWGFVAATVMLAPFAPDAAREIAQAPLAQVGTVVFLGVFPSAVAYLAWARALAVARSTSEVTHFMFLTPFLSLVLGYMVISEVPGPETFAGGTVILLGLALFHGAGRRALPGKTGARRASGGPGPRVG